MTKVRVLDWTWKLVVLALLLFCAVRLETLQRVPAPGILLTGPGAPNPVTGTPEQLRRIQQERAELLRGYATQPAAAAAPHHHP